MDATPVVADPNDVEATAFDGHVDVARACVEAVLEQFLHDLSGPVTCFNSLNAKQRVPRPEVAANPDDARKVSPA